MSVSAMQGGHNYCLKLMHSMPSVGSGVVSK